MKQTAKRSLQEELILKILDCNSIYELDVTDIFQKLFVLKKGKTLREFFVHKFLYSDKNLSDIDVLELLKEI